MMLNYFHQKIADIAAAKDDVINKLIDYVRTDTLLFWSPNNELKSMQEKVWLPYLSWFKQKTLTDFKPSEGLDILPSNISSSEKIKYYLQNLSDIKLACLYFSTLELRSLILGLAFVEKFAPANDIIRAAFLEEKFQESKWGENNLLEYNLKAISDNLSLLEDLLQHPNH